MCTIGILLRPRSDLPLVVVANRDEWYARPARGPAILDDRVGAAGGIDARSGGTWLAITPRGRIVAVTNQRAAVPPVPGVRSRGHAVLGAIAADNLDGYVRGLDPREFSSMNLVYGDATALRVAYFRREPGTVDIDQLPAGVQVLCNDRIESPDFPRGQRVAGVLRANADAPWPVARARLAAALADHTRLAVAEDPLAEAMTAVCIHSPLYGTRSAAIVALGAGRVHQYLHAEGPPCTAPFVDHTGLVS